MESNTIIISNSKLGIWLCSQSRIDINSQSNFYYVLTRPYKYLSNTLYKTTCKEYILQLLSPSYETFTQISSNFLFLYILYWQDPIVTTTLTKYHRHDNTCVNFRVSKISVRELPYSVSDRPLDCLRKTTKLIDKLRSDLNKLHDKNQLLYKYMVEQLKNFKHLSQPQTVPDPFQGITLISRQKNMSGIKRCTIIWSTSFKISSFKCNLR